MSYDYTLNNPKLCETKTSSNDAIVTLSEDWEMRYDSTGLDYYLNHKNNYSERNNPSVKSYSYELQRKELPPPPEYNGPSKYSSQFAQCWKSYTYELNFSPIDFKLEANETNTGTKTSSKAPDSTVGLEMSSVELQQVTPDQCRIDLGSDSTSKVPQGALSEANSATESELQPSVHIQTYFDIRPVHADIEPEVGCCKAICVTYEQHSAYLFIFVLFVAAIVASVVVGVKSLLGVLIAFGLGYLLSMVVYGNCLPCCSCECDGCGAMFKNGTAAKFVQSPTIEVEEVEKRMQEYVSAIPKLVIHIENTHKRKKKGGGFIISSIYEIGVPITHWEDKSPVPSFYISDMNRLGMKGSMLSFNQIVDLHPDSHGDLEVLSRELGKKYKLDRSQTVTHKFVLCRPDGESIPAQDSYVIGPERPLPCLLNKVAYYLSLWTGTYLCFAVCGRLHLKEYVYPVYKRARIDRNQPVWLDSQQDLGRSRKTA